MTTLGEFNCHDAVFSAHDLTVLTSREALPIQGPLGSVKGKCATLRSNQPVGEINSPPVQVSCTVVEDLT